MPEYADFEHLKGLIQLEYLPTSRSRKWRKGPIRMLYCQQAFDDGVTLAKQEKWYAWRYVSY